MAPFKLIVPYDSRGAEDFANSLEAKGLIVDEIIEDKGKMGSTNRYVLQRDLPNGSTENYIGTNIILKYAEHYEKSGPDEYFDVFA